MQTLEANPLFVCVEVKSYNTDTVSLNCYFLIRAGMAIVMKVGHVILMILLVKMFERSKMVKIATGLDLLSYAMCIFLSSASLYILHNLHKGDHEEGAIPHL